MGLQSHAPQHLEVRDTPPRDVNLSDCPPSNLLLDGKTGGHVTGWFEVEDVMFERFKLYDLTFSATADAVVGALLALTIVVMVFA